MKKGLIKKITFSLIFIILFFVSFFTFYIKGKADASALKEAQLKKNLNLMKSTDKEPVKPKFETIDGITNILLLGADYRDGTDVSRTDSMLILTLDTNHNKIKLTSLLRDNLVEIPNYGKSKLNHSFAWGGIDLLTETIAKNYNLNIDKYLLVDFNGFKSVIDKLGGVEVEVKENELSELNKYIFDIEDKNNKAVEEAGVQTLNGAQALSFARIRKGVGDEYGRTERQRALLNSLMKKAKETSFTKYPNIAKSVLENIETNLSFYEIISLANTMLKIDMDNIETSYIPYTDLSISGEYKDYGWVFRTDLDLTAKLINKYIFLDEKPDLINIDKENLNYIN